SDWPCRRVETWCSRSLPSATSCTCSFVRIAAFARLTVCSGWSCDSCGLGGERRWCWSSRPRSTVGVAGGSIDAGPAPPERLAAEKPSLGRSANPRRVTEAGNRRLRTHRVALSTRPTAGAVTDVAYLPREPPRPVHGRFADDVIGRAGR